MEIVLLLIGLLCAILGVFGSFLPVLPGPILSWFGILLLYCTTAVPANYWILGITFVCTLMVSVLEYLIPGKGAKLLGGSASGIRGASIGLLVGIFAPIPLGFIVGPFVGAFIGELIYDSKNHSRALKAATGTFIGFLVSGFMQFVVCLIYLGIFVTVAWKYRHAF